MGSNGNGGSLRRSAVFLLVLPGFHARLRSAPGTARLRTRIRCGAEAPRTQACMRVCEAPHRSTNPATTGCPAARRACAPYRRIDCNQDHDYDQDFGGFDKARDNVNSDILTSGGFRGFFPETGLALFHLIAAAGAAESRHQYRRGPSTGSGQATTRRPFEWLAIRLGACTAVECGNPLPPTGNPS